MARRGRHKIFLGMAPGVGETYQHQRSRQREQKRHEDVEAVLGAGIDAYSTVNVQHVESLAGQIATLTGVAVGETLPDRVIHEAEDVVLVDVTPELLIERLKAGKVYSDQSAAVAQSGFFRPDTLATLREISLLEVADEVEPGRKAELLQPAAPPKLASRPLLLATNRPAEPLARVLALTTPSAPWMRLNSA